MKLSSSTSFLSFFFYKFYMGNVYLKKSMLIFKCIACALIALCLRRFYIHVIQCTCITICILQYWWNFYFIFIDACFSFYMYNENYFSSPMNALPSKIFIKNLFFQNKSPLSTLHIFLHVSFFFRFNSWVLMDMF